MSNVIKEQDDRFDRIDLSHARLESKLDATLTALGHCSSPDYKLISLGILSRFLQNLRENFRFFQECPFLILSGNYGRVSN